MPADAFSRMDSSDATNSETAADRSGASGQSDLCASPSSPSLDSRQRTDSESSDPQAPRFVLPGTAGSPPKVLTIDEIKHALTNIDNMTLAHEIAVNPDFRLMQYQPPVNTLERSIKDMVHKAFWARIREQLDEQPPCYDNAIQLLADIKDGFAHILAANNKKALDRINEVLDATVIRQQAENGVLDFRAYANFIVQIMARSCAPVRDEQIAQLTQIDDTLDMFRGILEVMELLKLDMANCMIEASRKLVMTHSVQYERGCFREYLDVYNGAFPATEAWLVRNRDALLAATAGQPTGNTEAASPARTPASSLADRTILAAYVDLLVPNNHPIPETVTMDADRIRALSARYLRLLINACVVPLAKTIPAIAGHAAYQKQLRDEVAVILESVTDASSLSATVENVWLQVRSIVGKALDECRVLVPGEDSATPQLSADIEQSLREHILALASETSPLRTVMNDRLKSYAALLFAHPQSVPPPPPGFGDFADELELFIVYRRIAFYNYRVYGEFYHKVVNGELSSTSAEAGSTAVPPTDADVTAIPSE